MNPHHLRRVRRSILRQRIGNLIVNLPAYFARMARAAVAASRSMDRLAAAADKFAHGELLPNCRCIIPPARITITAGPPVPIDTRTPDERKRDSFLEACRGLPDPYAPLDMDAKVKIASYRDPRTGNTILHIVKPKEGEEFGESEAL
jgi:hypothetical protein